MSKTSRNGFSGTDPDLAAVFAAVALILNEQKPILPHQPRTAVYTSPHGHVVVRQEQDAYEEEDPVVVFTPQGALATAWAMIEEAI